MLRFYAQSFVSATSTISQLAHILRRGEGFSDTHLQELGGALGELHREVEKVDLPMTKRHLQGMKEAILNRNFGNYHTISQQLEELMSRLWDELDMKVFYQIEPAKVRFYQEPEALAGDQVVKAFPSAAAELLEASRCFGVGQYTASVFHAMRGLEPALASMAAVFGISVERQNWQNIVEQIESTLRDLPKNRPPNWKQDLHFYSKAASHFMFLKDAWRNYTMHLHEKYEENVALRLLDNVSSFLKELSVRLHE
jgi:hypothetical protein